MNHSISSRIEELIKKLELTQNAFAKELGTSSSRISNITTGRNKPDSELLSSIVKKFRNVSASWLLTGEGEMLEENVGNQLEGKTNSTFSEEKRGANDLGENARNDARFDARKGEKTQTKPTYFSVHEESPTYLKKGLQILPIVVTPQNTERIVAVPFFAEAGYTRGFQDSSFIQELPHFSLPQLSEGTYRAFQIRGDSMEPSITSGDWVIGRYVDRVDGLQAGTICVILLRDDGILCKRVEKRGKIDIILHSNNPRYEPIEASSKTILEMWEVRAVLRYLF
jgi:SOS-response transcriptional repressor LexA